jgi:hypothetical protein
MKRSFYSVLAALGAVIVGVPSVAQEAGEHLHGEDLHSPYAGEETREIRTLSEEDIEQLQAGAGWGLAKAAELNGLPGPAHLLEMADREEMRFSAEQLERIRNLHREMADRAIPLGFRLIEQERELNRGFADGTITEQALQELLAEIAETTATLRFVHLSAHLKTLPILSPHQIHTYNRLRGYALGEDRAPAGHSPMTHPL